MADSNVDGGIGVSSNFNDSAGRPTAVPGVPLTGLRRIMKEALPKYGKIDKDAVESLQKCVSEFICLITNEANDRCKREDRKTMNGDDILWSLAYLGFEDYIVPLKRYLFRHRELSEKAGAEVGSTARESRKRTRNVDRNEKNVNVPGRLRYDEGEGYMEPKANY